MALKKCFTALSMKVTTTPKDCDKVDQIIPIMQEHLGLVMNLSRIKLLTFALHALCIVQTVSLHKIASAMPTSVERDPNLRRVRPGRNRKRTTQISLQAEIRCFQIFVMYLVYAKACNLVRKRGCAHFDTAPCLG